MSAEAPTDQPVATPESDQKAGSEPEPSQGGGVARCRPSPNGQAEDSQQRGAPSGTPGQQPWEVRIEGENDRDILIVCSLVLLLAFVFSATPARDGVTIFGARLPEVCGVKRMGWGECPGCGLTRSFILGVRLDPEAFKLHPAGPILLLIVAAQIPFRGLRMWRRKRLARDGLVDLGWGRWETFWKVLPWSILVIIVGGWALRMGWLP